VSLSNRRIEGPSFDTGLRLRSAPTQDERIRGKFIPLQETGQAPFRTCPLQSHTVARDYSTLWADAATMAMVSAQEVRKITVRCMFGLLM
jgi:hypothetical protein